MRLLTYPNFSGDCGKNYSVSPSRGIREDVDKDEGRGRRGPEQELRLEGWNELKALGYTLRTSPKILLTVPESVWKPGHRNRNKFLVSLIWRGSNKTCGPNSSHYLNPVAASQEGFRLECCPWRVTPLTLRPQVHYFIMGQLRLQRGADFLFIFFK